MTKIAKKNKNAYLKEIFFLIFLFFNFSSMLIKKIYLLF